MTGGWDWREGCAGGKGCVPLVGPTGHAKSLISACFHVGPQTVDLSDAESLKVTIADALNEQDIVKFTIQTKVQLK